MHSLEQGAGEGPWTQGRRAIGGRRWRSVHSCAMHEKLSRMDLPSLNALRAFEVAARLGSFTRAAAELHVTQSAVSHQVGGLEEELGTRLFERRPRALLLTPAGAALAEA